MLKLRLVRLANIVLVAVCLAVSAVAAPIALHVDATQAARKIFFAEMTIPATPGPFTLVYPKWIPGEHGPTGPITDLAGLRISAAGRPIEWTRDAVEMYA